MTTHLVPRRGPATRRPRADQERGSGAEASDLSARITSIRSEAFELVSALAAAGGRHGPELEAVSGQMQDIANQLGAVQARIQELEA
jgi:hypothetical protein